MFGRSLVPQSGTAVASIAAPSVPVQVTKGIRDLLISFASQGQGDNDARRLMEIYGRATTEVAEVIALEAVQSLLFDNPRNPFRPSPQDVYERCERIEKELRGKITEYFIGWNDAWWPAKWGGAPLTATCLIPDDLIKKYLALSLARGDLSVDCDLKRLTRKRFERIPAECFASEDQRKGALAEISARSGGRRGAAVRGLH